MNSFNKTDIYISKMIFNKVFAEEFRPIHSREMVLDTTYGNMHTLSNAIAHKRSFSLNTNDLLAVPDLITLSDMPSADEICVNGGWGVDRYSFIMEITIEEVDATKNLYLSGYTDRDDLFSLQSGAINPEMMLIFNDCLTTQTTYPNGMPTVRIINNVDILPDAEQDHRVATIRPSDCFTYMEGLKLEEILQEESNGKEKINFTDTRLVNTGGRISSKHVTSLDNHLTTVANSYVQASIKSDSVDYADGAISDVTWNAREQATYTTIDLFKLIWEHSNINVTNHVEIGTLLTVAPMRFKNPSSDYIINEKRRGDLDKELSRLAKLDENFNALATIDSESTAIISVEVKLAQLFLQELTALMGLYKITRLAISATNEETDFNGEPIVIPSAVDTIVSNVGISKVLVDNFLIAFKNKVFNKICKNNDIAVTLFAYAGFSSEKVEISINSKPPIVIALPKFMSSSFSPLVGTISELRNISSSYRDMFLVLDKNVEEIRDSNSGEIIRSAR